METRKSVNDLLNELVEAQIITEGHKLLILRTAEKEKEEAVKTLLLERSKLIAENIELKDECRQQA